MPYAERIAHVYGFNEEEFELSIDLLFTQCRRAIALCQAADHIIENRAAGDIKGEIEWINVLCGIVRGGRTIPHIFE
jgi:hypothetical protein